MVEPDADPEDVFGEGQLNEQIDAELLMGALGIDDQEIAWRKEFIDFDDDDEQRLASLEPTFRANQDEIADLFYQNLTNYDQSIAVFSRSPKKISQLKATQKAYLTSLATGDYDQEYFQNRARIGLLHYLLDMPMKQYIGQYGVYYTLIISVLNQRIQEEVITAVEEWAASQDGGDSGGFLGFGASGTTEMTKEFETTIRSAIDDGMEDVLSVLRAINLDMQMATDAYMFAYRQDLLEDTHPDDVEEGAFSINQQSESKSDGGRTGISDDISDILSEDE